MFLWDLDGNDFAGVFLIKKTQDVARGGTPMQGTWDSIHVVEVTDNGNSADYALTSTIMLNVETDNDKTGSVSLAGSLTRQDSQQGVVIDRQMTHVANIGSLIENMENRMRTLISTIYFGKTKDIVNDLRKRVGAKTLASQRAQPGAIASQLGQ